MAGDDPDQQVKAAFELALGRSPTADEIEQAINRIRMKQMQTQLDGHDRPQVPGTIARIGDHA